MNNSKDGQMDSLLEELKKYDNQRGYRLSHDTVKKKLHSTMEKLTSSGENCLEKLHALLEHEETWSCYFAVEMIKDIRSEKSIMPLITFMEKNEDGGYWESCGDASQALTSIGEAAIDPLLARINAHLKNKHFPGFLMDTLTSIKHDRVYEFMASALESYLKDKEEYEDWFNIAGFTINFDVQGKKEIIPRLRAVLEDDDLSEFKRREIESTIEALDNPEGHKSRLEALTKRPGEKTQINKKALIEKALALESQKEYDNALAILDDILLAHSDSYHALFLCARIKRKLGKPDVMMITEAHKEMQKQKASKDMICMMEDEKKRIQELHEELQTISDEDLVLHFRCRCCNRKQNHKPGIVLQVNDVTSFENEIMCKSCHSHDLELTKEGYLGLLGQQMRSLAGEATGILHIDEKVFVEGKKMAFCKAYPYLLKRIGQEPDNAELHLRAGNAARKTNKYEEAIRHYKKAIELDSRYIAAYVNLVEIYAHRHAYYKTPGAKKEAIAHLQKMRRIYDSKDYNTATIANPSSIVQMIREKEVELGVTSTFQRIKGEDVDRLIKSTSTLDLHATTKDLQKRTRSFGKEARKMLDENKGVPIFQAYLLLDQKTKESRCLGTMSVMPVGPTKRCICGSEKHFEGCCLGKGPFVANMDYDTYSTYAPMKTTIKTDEEMVKEFREDPRFYCMEETKRGACFLYLGDTIFIDKKLGTVVFGTITLKKGYMSSLKIEAMSENRFRSLLDAVKEHIG